MAETGEVTSERLKGEQKYLTYNPKKVVCDKPVFSAHHPMIPKRYVPPWQMDMKNRKLISQVLAYNFT